MLENMKPPKTNWSCKVRTIRATLDAADQVIFDNMIADPEWPANTLSNELAKLNIILVGHTIAKHRKGLCSCSKQ